MRDSDTRINFSTTCRVCLAEEKDMKSIFSVEQILENEIQLSDILMSCSAITIEKHEGLPEKICYRCFEQANIAYLFKKLCESSDSTLRELSKQFDIQRDLLTEGDKENVISDVISLREQEVISKNGKENPMFNDPNEDLSSSSNEENKQIDELNILHQEPKELSQLLSNNNGSYICEFCSTRFTSKKLISAHIKSKHNFIENHEKDNVKKELLPTSCDICCKVFRFHSNLQRHKLTHTGEKPYLCNVCGRSFAQLTALKIHSFTHTGEKPYKCQICTQSFGAPGTLLTHLRTHTGERPHICKICGKQFPQAGYLSSHVRTHTGEKPVECRICGQRFNQSGRLTTHMRIHSGEKPYQCEVCQRGFAVKGTLKKHLRTHTGERPYTCKTCGKSFAQNGTLATHLKVHRLIVN